MIVVMEDIKLLFSSEGREMGRKHEWNVLEQNLKNYLWV
jgi:hypothetical protein